MTINKGQRRKRQPTAHGPLDATYTYRTNEKLKASYTAVAGPAEINQFMAWFTGEPDAELPERPCDARKVA